MVPCVSLFSALSKGGHFLPFLFSLSLIDPALLHFGAFFTYPKLEIMDLLSWSQCYWSHFFNIETGQRGTSLSPLLILDIWINNGRILGYHGKRKVLAAIQALWRLAGLCVMVYVGLWTVKLRQWWRTTTSCMLSLLGIAVSGGSWARWWAGISLGICYQPTNLVDRNFTMRVLVGH